MNECNFWCENCNCGAVGSEKDFVLSTPPSKENKTKCPINKKLTLKFMGHKTFGDPVTTRGQHKNGRMPAEKNKRRSTHFRKEILPEIGGWERKHFIKKLGKPL